MARKKARTTQVTCDDGIEVHVTASQRVSSIEDVLHHIFLFLDNKDLVSLVRVSKGFFVPAARWLWFELTNSQLYGLLDLLPVAVKQVESRNPTTNKVTTTEGRAVIKRDLIRWHIYAPFIRSFTWSSAFSPSKADIQLFHNLALVVPKESLLPNLTSIFMRPSEDKLVFLKHLLCPSLRHLSLLGEVTKELEDYEDYVGDILDLEAEDELCLPFDISESSHYSIISFLDALPIHAPHLTKLYCVGLPPDLLEDASISLALSECIQALPELDNIYLDNFGRSTSVLSSLVRLRRLQWLTIEPVCYFVNVSRDDEDSPALRSEGFWKQQMPANGADVLVELEGLQLIWKHSPEFAIGLLTHLRPPLCCLRITPSFPDGAVATPLLNAIVQTCSELNELTIVVCGTSLPSDLWTSLQLLKGLPLTELAVVIANCKNVSDPNEHLLAIGTAHPNLHKLVFDIKEDDADAANEPTLGCLLSLAEACPHLTDLRLGSLFTSSESYLALPVQCKALERLRIRRSHVAVPYLAKFVAAIWPNARVMGLKENTEINCIVEAVRHVRRVGEGEASLGI